DEVGDVDPRPPLASAPDAAADAEPEGSEKARENPTRRRENESLTEVDDADSGGSRAFGRGFPRATDLGEESGPESRLLGQDVVSSVEAVDGDSACAHEHARSLLERDRRR